jgi:FkbM family methyltransferase
MSDKLDQLARSLQNLGGRGLTNQAQHVLGLKGTRFVRYVLRRALPYHVQVNLRTERVGGPDAAWVICPDDLSPSTIVYSLGVGDEIQFDLSLIEKYSLNVYAFDPTPEAVAWIGRQKLPNRFHFIDYGVLDYDGTAQFQQFDGVQFGTRLSASQNTIVELKVFRLATIMKELTHTKIDLLKINIEGGEYAVLADMLASGINVNQIVVEFHHRLPGYSLQQTRRAVDALNHSGYKIFHISDADKEYSFIKS